jgi:hypothetical protein
MTNIILTVPAVTSTDVTAPTQISTFAGMEFQLADPDGNNVGPTQFVTANDAGVYVAEYFNVQLSGEYTGYVSPTDQQGYGVGPQIHVSVSVTSDAPPPPTLPTITVSIPNSITATAV